MLFCSRPDLASAYPEGIEEMARLVGCATGALREAVSFWKGTGILDADMEIAEPKRTVKADRALIKDTVPEYSGEELAALVEGEDGKIKSLIDGCQEILCKIFNRTEIEKLVALCDYLRLENEYVLLLAHHCARQNKKSVAYVVKTAYSLFNEGIDDYPKLEAYLKYKEKYQSQIGRLRRLFGIGERELTKKESGFIKQWIEDFNLPFEVIELAYQITIDSIKELSFDYMGKILSGWYAQGAVTVEQVNLAIEQRKKQKQEEAKASDFSSFDTDEFFSAALKRSMDAMKQGH
jgi:DnaD/phage-associated family protein